MTESFWSPVLLSLKVASCSTVLVVVLGTLLGRFFARRRFRGKTLLETLLLVPMVLPPTVIGFGLLMLLGQQGVGQILAREHSILFTWYAAVIASTVVSLPLMYQAARTGFETVEEEYEAVAMTYGANRWQVFWYITLPLAWPALLSGTILSFAKGLGEFGATLMVAGNIPGRTQTLPLGIYNAVETGQNELAWLWVGCLFVLSFVMMWGIRKLQGIVLVR